MVRVWDKRVINSKETNMRTIHDEVNEKLDLAKAYAEDGAFASAARILREAADMYQRRAEEFHAEMDARRAR